MNLLLALLCASQISTPPSGPVNIAPSSGGGSSPDTVTGTGAVPQFAIWDGAHTITGNLRFVYENPTSENDARMYVGNTIGPFNGMALTNLPSIQFWTGSGIGAKFDLPTGATLRLTLGGLAAYQWNTNGFIPLLASTSTLGDNTNPWVSLSVDSGTAPTPSLRMGDGNSGLYGGADQVNVSTAGVKRFSVDTSNTTSTLPFLAPDGSVTLVGYGFASNPRFGLYLDPTGDDVLWLNGVSATGTGSVAIGAGDTFQVLAGDDWSISDDSAATSVSGVESTGLQTIKGTIVRIDVPGTNWEFDADGLESPRTTTVAASPDYTTFPSSISTAPGAPSTCSSVADATKTSYIDDTGDGLPAFLCVCAANGANAYAWRPIGDFTSACP